jgi:hypothetical protein
MGSPQRIRIRDILFEFMGYLFLMVILPIVGGMILFMILARMQ